MTLQFVFFVLIIHFLADFGLQTHWQAMNKSTSDKALFKHVLTYTLVWLVAAPVYLRWEQVMIFSVMTGCLHFITDYITSRLSKPLFDEGDFHNGFVIVGADQVAHYVQLFLTFYIFMT